MTQDSLRNPVQHPVFWFEDGSLVFRVEDHAFKVHRTLLSRHSGFFAQSKPRASNTSGINVDLSLDVHIVVDPIRQVAVRDVEILLEHFYHDV
jgi:hypothetical protein